MEQVLQSFIDELKDREEVLGVVVFGSYARGQHRPDSDIDLYVLIKQGSYRGIEQRQGINFEIVFSSAEESRLFAKKRPDDLLNLWRDGRILYDKEGGIRQLQKEAHELEKKGKPALDEQTLNHLRFSAEDTLRAVSGFADKDKSSATLTFHKLLHNLIILYFDKNRIFIPAPKQMIPYLRDTFPNVAEIIDDLYREADLKKQIPHVRKLMDTIFIP